MNKETCITIFIIFICNAFITTKAVEKDNLFHKDLSLCYPEKVSGFYDLDEPHRCARIKWETVKQFQVYILQNLIMFKPSF